MSGPIDTANYQMVAVRGEEIVILRPKSVMTKQQALLHAAWLVALASESVCDETTNDFLEIWKAVCST